MNVFHWDSLQSEKFLQSTKQFHYVTISFLLFSNMFPWTHSLCVVLICRTQQGRRGSGLWRLVTIGGRRESFWVSAGSDLVQVITSCWEMVCKTSQCLKMQQDLGLMAKKKKKMMVDYDPFFPYLKSNCGVIYPHHLPVVCVHALYRQNIQICSKRKADGK